MGKKNNSIIISAVLVAFLVGTMFSSPNYALALPPWANDILVSIGVLETTTADLQTQINNIPTGTDASTTYYTITDAQFADCDLGDIATGGGFTGTEISSSFPVTVSGVPIGWEVAGNIVTDVYVVCLDLGTPHTP